jgi:hypothetical protein
MYGLTSTRLCIFSKRYCAGLCIVTFTPGFYSKPSDAETQKDWSYIHVLYWIFWVHRYDSPTAYPYHFQNIH